jgi:hypothetical protein
MAEFWNPQGVAGAGRRPRWEIVRSEGQGTGAEIHARPAEAR